MKRSLRQFVRERAGRRCEYCHIPDAAVPAASFHLEHVLAKQHGGVDAPHNRCWSCHRCNFRKGPNLSGRDPLTGKVVRLFNPRRQRWQRHFEWMGFILVGEPPSAEPPSPCSTLMIRNESSSGSRSARLEAETDGDRRRGDAVLCDVSFFFLCDRRTVVPPSSILTLFE